MFLDNRGMGLDMPVKNWTADMVVKRGLNGVLEVSNRPVGMRFKRSCGTVVRWEEKEEVCMCDKCRSK